MAEIKGKKKLELPAAAYGLLCVGDVLVSIQGESVDGTPFDVQLAHLRTARRPLLLEFVSSEAISTI